MVTLKEKKKLIRTIKNPVRYFRLNFSRHGGEVAMGTITKDQYDYWSDNDGFEEYMVAVDFDADDANKEIPKRAERILCVRTVFQQGWLAHARHHQDRAGWH